MSWINVAAALPADGQEVYYFSPILGLWRGKYTYCPFTHATWYDENNQPHEEETSEALRRLVSPHVFYCEAGNCDTDEVTHWQPYDAARAAAGWVPLPPNHGISAERMAEYRAWRAPNLPSSTLEKNGLLGRADREVSELSAEEAAALSEDAPKNRPTVAPQKLLKREISEYAWMDADVLNVDPPSGSRYGFPKTWNKKTHPDFVAWLIEHGYPAKLARKDLICRFMTLPPEETTREEASDK
jgi:hypothetical protein